MKQRLGIAQSLLNDPEILILDEPTVGLDPKERIRFKNLISSLGKDKTIILSTHIVGDIEYIANEILILKQGHIIEKGSPSFFLDNLRGKVWEIEVEFNDLESIKDDYVVSNQKLSGNSAILRVISDTCPDPNAKLSVPNFEDVYLNYFPNKGES